MESSAMISTADPTIEGLDWLPDFDLSKATSMGVGGSADALATAHDEEALCRFLAWAKGESVRYWMLGGGSNTIFRGDRFEGVVLRLGREFTGVSVEDEVYLRAGAAAHLSKAVKVAQSHGLAGLEFGIGIPGQIGGALAGNAGQQGEAVCETLDRVHAVDLETCEPVDLSRGDFDYGYRRSTLRNFVLLDARFLLKREEPRVIKDKMQAFLSIRWDQPVGVKCSGCVFKNPEGDSAGRLIDEAGLKGFSIGGAEVSAEHANFIFNRKGATAREVMDLLSHVKNAVRERYGVDLDYEVRLVD